MPRISQLQSLTAADNSDEIAIVDVSASTTKKITRGDLLKAPLPANSVTTAAITDGAVTSEKVNSATFTVYDSGQLANWSDTGVSNSNFIEKLSQTLSGLVIGQKYEVTIQCSEFYGNVASSAQALVGRIDGTPIVTARQAQAVTNFSSAALYQSRTFTASDTSHTLTVGYNRTIGSSTSITAIAPRVTVRVF